MSRTKKGGKGAGFEFWTARPGNKHGGGVGKTYKRTTHKIERQHNKPTKADIAVAMQDLAEIRDVCGDPSCEYCGTTHNVQIERRAAVGASSRIQSCASDNESHDG